MLDSLWNREGGWTTTNASMQRRWGDELVNARVVVTWTVELSMGDHSDIGNIY
jgi:hypothetical protein